MRTQVARALRLAVLVAVAGLALAGCGRLTRISTINQVTTTSGATTAATLEQQLAAHGVSGAHVTCAKTMIVNVGTNTSCTVTGAGQSKTVRFSFASSNGRVSLGSVKTS